MHEIIYMYCCRVWPIVPGATVGRCGLCGRQPDRMATKQEVEQHLHERGTT